MPEELAAAAIELAHAHYRAALQIGGVKRSRLPHPLHIPRPTPWTPSQNPARSRPLSTATSPVRRQASTVAEVVAIVSAGFGPSRR